MFYDLTTIRAEGLSEQVGDVRRHGRAKDGNIERQFVLGVVQSADGLPLRHEVHVGTVAELRTLKGTLERAMRRFPIRRVIAIADGTFCIEGTGTPRCHWRVIENPLGWYYHDLLPSPPKISAQRPADEKLTINLGVVDLGQIDLLVSEGFYSNRSDLIRAAIRRELERHADTVRAAAERRTLVLGIREFTASDLEKVRKSGEKLVVRVLGLASFAPDVTPELALETIESITVLGALHASPALKRALAERLR